MIYKVAFANLKARFKAARLASIRRRGAEGGGGAVTPRAAQYDPRPVHNLLAADTIPAQVHNPIQGGRQKFGCSSHAHKNTCD